MYCEGDGENEEQARREEGPELGAKNKASPGDCWEAWGRVSAQAPLTNKQSTDEQLSHT